jgi:hypothetical protein
VASALLKCENCGIQNGGSGFLFLFYFIFGKEMETFLEKEKTE